MSSSTNENLLRKHLLPGLLRPGTTLGAAVRDAKAELAAYRPSAKDVLIGWTLLGDPALVVEP